MLLYLRTSKGDINTQNTGERVGDLIDGSRGHYDWAFPRSLEPYEIRLNQSEFLSHDTGDMLIAVKTSGKDNDISEMHIGIDGSFYQRWGQRVLDVSDINSITDIESVGDGFIRFKKGYQICWGIEISSNMNHPGTGSGGGGGIMPISVDGNAEIIGGTKTITFPVPFSVIPVIAISPASAITYGRPHNNIINPPAAWYHHESPTDFIAELSSAVKFTWIAIGTWK